MGRQKSIEKQNDSDSCGFAAVHVVDTCRSVLESALSAWRANMKK